MEFLRAEPLRAFEENKKTEERKKKSAEPGAPAGRKPHATEGEADPHPETTSPISDLAKPEPAANGILADAAPGGEVGPAEAAMGMGMMGGMGRRGVVPPAPEVKYEATAWGRYVKVLLSSSEFMFIN